MLSPPGMTGPTTARGIRRQKSDWAKAVSDDRGSRPRQRRDRPRRSRQSPPHMRRSLGDPTRGPVTCYLSRSRIGSPPLRGAEERRSGRSRHLPPNVAHRVTKARVSAYGGSSCTPRADHGGGQRVQTSRRVERGRSCGEHNIHVIREKEGPIPLRETGLRLSVAEVDGYRSPMPSLLLHLIHAGTAPWTRSTISRGSLSGGSRVASVASLLLCLPQRHSVRS
jgi:hypothetical protein